MQFLVLVFAALALLAPGSVAQSIIWKPIVAPTMPTVHANPVSQWPALEDGLSYPVTFEKCPVTDEFGNRIYVTQVKYYVNLVIEGDLTFANTNPAGLPSSDMGWGAFGIGARPFLSKLPLGEDANHSPLWHTGGENAVAGSLTWPALAAGQSVSKHVRGQGNMLFLHRVGTDEYRKWQGPGSTTFYVTLDRWVHADVQGHWSVSGEDTMRVAVFGLAADGSPCHGFIGYEYTTTPPVERFSIVEGPWSETGSIRADNLDPQPITMHGFTGDLSRVAASWIEIMQANRLPRWIENTTTTQGGICGGDAQIVAQWLFPATWANVPYTTGVGSGQQLVSPFDSVLDGLGASGRTEPVSTGFALRTVVPVDPAFAPSLTNGEVDVSMRVTSSRISPESITPGCAFAWSGEWFTSGWVRAVTKRRL